MSTIFLVIGGEHLLGSAKPNESHDLAEVRRGRAAWVEIIRCPGQRSQWRKCLIWSSVYGMRSETAAHTAESSRDRPTE